MSTSQRGFTTREAHRHRDARADCCWLPKRRYNEQLLDSGTSSKLSAKSIRLSGKDISWTHDGVKRTAKIGEVALSVTAGGGPTAAT